MRSREAEDIELAQHGAGFVHPPSVSELETILRGGARDLAFWLHGARREVHDFVSGEAGSFAATLRALSIAQSHGARTAVLSALTRSSARVLSEMPSLLLARSVSLWVVVAPSIDEEPFSAIIPRLGLGVPAALAALDRAKHTRLDARILGLPLCTLGPFARTALASEARSFGRSCEGCRAQPSCAGVDARYLERFGDTELRPLDAPPIFDREPALAALAARLAATFPRARQEHSSE